MNGHVKKQKYPQTFPFLPNKFQKFPNRTNHKDLTVPSINI